MKKLIILILCSFASAQIDTGGSGGGGGTVTAVTGTANQVTVTGTTTPVISLANPPLTGTAVPSSGCTAAGNLGAIYVQTNTTGLPGGMTTWSCGNDGTSYRWVQTSSGRVNVMSLGAKADASTDDAAAINAAVTFAASLNHYTGPVNLGASVYFPCGQYNLASPIVLPRSANHPGWGSVPLLGESSSCVWLNGAFAFVSTPTNILIVDGGQGYTSGAATCSLSSGASIWGGMTCAAAADVTGQIVSMTISGTPSCGSSPCTVPVVTITGGGSPTRTAIGIMVGKGLIEWDTSVARNHNQRIEHLTLNMAQADGAMGIHKHYTNYPSNSTNQVTEREFGLVLNDIYVVGNNRYNPACIYIEGDLFAALATNINCDPGATNAKYNTIAIASDHHLDGTTHKNLSDEGSGWQWSTIRNINAAPTRGGFSAAFIGRLMSSQLTGGFANGSKGTQSDGSPMLVNYSWGFLNSCCSSIQVPQNEGQEDAPQFLLEGSWLLNMDPIGMGTPNSVTAFGIGNGIELINSSENTFANRPVNTSAASAAWRNSVQVTSTVIDTGGSGCAGTVPTFSSGGTAATGTATVASGAVTAIVLTNAGVYSNTTPTISFSGGCTATAHAVMSALGTFWMVKTDSNSHYNRFKNFEQAGDPVTLPDFSFADTATNYAQTRDGVTAGSPFVTVGTNFDLGLNHRRTCTMVVGSDNGSALANADLGPQLNQCFIPFAATVIEIEVMADAGTPNVIVQRSHLGTPTALLSGALATAASGAVACSNTGGTTGLDGTTTCTNTLQNTAVAVGDWIGLTSGTAGGTAKRMTVAVTMTVN